jgi:hypothetical protein
VHELMQRAKAALPATGAIDMMEIPVLHWRDTDRRAQISFAPGPRTPPHDGIDPVPRATSQSETFMAFKSYVRFVIVAALASQAAMLWGCAALVESGSEVVGTWVLVSSVTERDGTKTDQFGSGAKGMLTLSGDGHFMLTIIGPDLPKFASGNRAAGTLEENKAVVSKSIAMIGNYSVNSRDKTLTFKVDSATFPNWNGTEQTRLLSSGDKDELKYITPNASSGGVGTVIWRRAH